VIGESVEREGRESKAGRHGFDDELRGMMVLAVGTVVVVVLLL